MGIQIFWIWCYVNKLKNQKSKYFEMYINDYINTNNKNSKNRNINIIKNHINKDNINKIHTNTSIKIIMHINIKK